MATLLEYDGLRFSLKQIALIVSTYCFRLKTKYSASKMENPMEAFMYTPI